MERRRRLAALLLALLFVAAPRIALASPFSWLTGEREAAPIESGALRVYLKSLGDIRALGITVDGSYTVDGDAGFRFARGTALTVAADGDGLVLSSGGLTIWMGASFTLTRHATPGANGLYLHGSERDNLFEGDLMLTNEAGAIRAVLTIDIERYLYGVVPYEMSDSFPIEALKAQAVAARTYALKRREANQARAYDLVDTTQDQVYKGLDRRNENAIAAVDATRGVAGEYGGSYANCYYTASNGGQTALPQDIWGGGQDMHYLTMRDDPYDLANPASVVRTLDVPAGGGDLPQALADMLRRQLPEAMASLGYSDDLADIAIERVAAIEPTQPMGAEGSRRYSKLRFSLIVSGRALPYPTGQPTPAAQTAVPAAPAPPAAQTATPTPQTPAPSGMHRLDQPVVVTLDVFSQIKRELGLDIQKNDYELASVAVHYEGDGVTPSAFQIQLRRFGHGVGMSQRGAQWMAGQYGKPYVDILNFYYPGMALVTRTFETPARQAVDSLPASLGAARARPTPRPTQAPLPALAAGEYYAVVALGSKASSLNVRSQPSTSSAILGALSSGDRVIVVREVEEGWVEIRTAEVDGYVALDYLTKE
ncbi:MAG: SpoIID/LytB domain-containing protein [Clostridiales bacterium]|nr:SpoIID/LytB domain-containing protein [Clostridiales bacterium]